MIVKWRKTEIWKREFMAWKIYHPVEHKILNIYSDVFRLALLSIYLEILIKMYEKIEYHRMNYNTPS